MPTISEILLYKYPTFMASGDIMVGDAGQGQYISYWNTDVIGIPKPTIAQVNAYVNDNDYKYNLAIFNRLNAPDGYKPIGEQFDMLFHDLQNNTQNLQTHRNTVKYINYPRPNDPNTNTDITQIVVKKRNSVSAAFRELVIAQSSGVQAITTIGKTTLAFGTKINDQNNVLNSGVITVMTGGVYEVTATLQVTNQALTIVTAFYNWQLFLTVISGGSTNSYLIDQYTHGLLSTAPATLQGTLMTPIALNAGDKIRIDVQKDLVGSLNVTSAMLNCKKICEA